jgi:hypothetical protein
MRFAKLPVLKAILPFVISGICLAWVYSLRSIEFEGLAHVLSSPAVWAATFFAHMVSTLVAGVRWKVLISGEGEKSPAVSQLFLVTWASQIAGAIPLGTDALRFRYMLKSLKMTVGNSARAALLDRVYGLAGLFVVFGMAILAQWAGPGVLLLLIFTFLVKKEIRFLLAISSLNHALKVLTILFVVWKPAETGFLSFLVNAQKIAIGLLADGMPFSLNGLGLGHLAFEFQAPGQGIEVYNSIFVLKTAFMLMGVFPLLWLLRRRAPIAQVSSKVRGFFLQSR